MQEHLVSVLLPAKNEAQTILPCITTYISHPRVGEVIVIANGCNDDTADLARESKAKVIELTQKGKGNAIMIGASMAIYPIIVCLDSDTPNPQLSIITKLLNAFPNGKKMIKGSFERNMNPGPVTDILVKPILQKTGHPLGRLLQPLSGIFACDKEWFCSLNLAKGYGVDLDLILKAINMKIEIDEINIGTFEHSKREWNHYVEMSLEITDVLLSHGFLNKM